ncbi:Glyoxalase/bleomycin resistance protein/dioxygenase [uncultured Sporomusa sp.]|uniref:Glyoxalase/bleomycin resistance protein/dioxygenase n=1 Tax=uncultured Sporomusa sp. TaxID=307249 RepID=A0A212LZ05_9FIRM|nr:VOC family protein [uncultured Sporomusa sp.]SCM82736.1 Glyoxalase/bleomycin resistance protein/dioxygenase [uncultured Sporomusa sp.]
MNRINLIALGVRDIKKSRAFYRDGLGFATRNNEEDPQIVFFNNGGTKLELYPLEELAKDINEANPPAISNGFSGITLAYNAKSKEEVDSIFSKIEGIGGSIVKQPQLVFWGGYSGYFRDLDGYYWEVAYADSWKFDENDMLIIEG